MTITEFPSAATRRTAAPGAAAQRRAPAPVTAGRVTLSRVAASEWIKMRSLRSTTWALLAAATSIVGLGTFTAIGLVVQRVPADGFADAAMTDPTGGALAGVSLAGYIVAGLGVLAVTSEYRSAGITVSLAAVPTRWHLVVGKALVVGTITFITSLMSTGFAFFAAKAVLATADVTISLSAPGVPRAVVGAALYLAFLAVVGTAYGWLLRSTAGAVVALIGVLVLLPVLLYLLPTSLGAAISPYLPSNAGTAIMQLAAGDHLAPWTGFAVFVGYVAVVLTSATALLRRRDA
jgi:hypothetical protein